MQYHFLTLKFQIIGILIDDLILFCGALCSVAMYDNKYKT